MKLNFREEYCRQYQDIAPDPQLLAAAEKLLCEHLAVPASRPFVGTRCGRRGGVLAVGLCLAVLAVSPQVSGLLQSAMDDAAGGAERSAGASAAGDVHRPGLLYSIQTGETDNWHYNAASGGNTADDGQKNSPDVGDAAGKVPENLLKNIGEAGSYMLSYAGMGMDELPSAAALAVDDAVCGQPTAPQVQKLTMDELYAMQEYAGLLPTVLPEGYVAEEAVLAGDGADAVLQVVWTHGYDYIRLQVRPFGEADAVRRVDIADPATWDQRYYASLLAEGQAHWDIWQLVPDELFDAMHYPIFTREELSADVLWGRCSESDDAGHYYGRFAVLYGDMLVDYTVRTDDLDAVWAAISGEQAVSN